LNSMLLELQGKNVLVTGSSGGIGKSIAQHFASEGCSVAVNGRESARVQAAILSIPGSVGVVGDVSTVQGAKYVIAEAVRQLGGLDIVVCNVGSGRSVPPGEEDFGEWQRVFSVNLWSTTNTVEHAVPELQKHQGCILCISSICGNEVIPGAPVTYSVAKAALNAYIKGIARPLGKRGVRICGIAPGNMLFDGSVWEKKLAENRSAVETMLGKEVALSSLGSPDQIARAAIFLASPLSNFITGSILTVDGGQVRA
jgi:3-oxoacyl-[acyl-carrier protein] reductase